jgi:hypothetical protein
MSALLSPLQLLELKNGLAYIHIFHKLDLLPESATKSTRDLD